MKRLFNIFLAVVLVLSCAFGLTACTTPDDGGNDKKGVLIKKENDVYVIYDYVDDGKLTDGILDLSVILGEKGITEAKIKSGAFDGADNIQKLIVPSAVVEIQQGAFRKMSNLYELEIPFVGLNAKADAKFEQTDSVENKAVDKERTFAHFFGTEEYEGGAILTNEFGTVYVPHTLSKVTVNAMQEYTISGVKEGYAIPMGAFEGAKSLQTIELKGDKLMEIGVEAFKGCTALTTITIPATVVKVYDYAFINCTNLREVEFLNDDVDVSDNAFEGCDKFTSET